MYTIAIDLGGTVVKIGLLSDGEIVDCVRLPSRLALGLALNLPKIKEAIDRLLAAWRIDVAALRCIGLAFPGLVDPIHNRVISTNEKYDDACSISLDKWAWENWEVPFCMDNDARLAVAGEWWQGAARGKNNVVMMTIGTGIGTGVVIDGRLLYGQHFQAGSLGGHFVLDYKGRRCSCGNKGCVEALSSSFFLPTIVREHALLSESFKRDADVYDFKRIFRLAQEGNEDALLIRNECMDIWASAIITYIHAYDPEVVILGGGILKSQEVIIPYISKRVDELAWCPSGKVPLNKLHLLFGVVTYSAGKLGQEPVRSQGHIHKISPYSGWSTPEIYEIWSGEAIIYMQEYAEDQPGRCYAVHAFPGDVVIVPPYWVHATISANPRLPLTFGAWCDRDYGFVYEGVRKHRGIAWFPVFNGSDELEWIANSMYDSSHLICKSPSDYISLDIRKGVSIYRQFEENPEIFLYVPNPALKAEVWRDFEP